MQFLPHSALPCRDRLPAFPLRPSVSNPYLDVSPSAIERTALRARLRAARRALPAAERIAGAQDLAQRLLQLPCLPASGFVAGYWANDGEIALHAWQLGLAADLQYCLPVLVDDRLRFAPWRPGEPLKSNRYGIPEPDVTPERTLAPEQMALIVLPLVGFDARGHRLGMGGGWYDRTLAFRNQRAAPPWLVGAAFDQQQIDTLPAESWDVPLDAICTPTRSLLPTRPGHPIA